MARLPSAETLGAAPSVASGRQVSTIDGSAYGRGLESLAQGMRSLSEGQAAQGRGYASMGREIASGINALAEEQRKKELLSENQLESQRTIERLKLEDAISKENDPNRIAELRGGFAKLDNASNQWAYSATSILTSTAPGKSPWPGRSLKLGVMATF